MLLKLPQLTDEEAQELILAWLKNPAGGHDSAPHLSCGHDLYVPRVIQVHLMEIRKEMQALGGFPITSHDQYDVITGSEPFYAAAWNLCTRGILYPSPDQDANRERLLAGFMLTNYGRSRLRQTSGSAGVPFEYGKFAQLLSGHSDRFGGGYQVRSLEAAKCYQAHLYYACCAMCGAAAESVLLALGVAKKGNEEEVVRIYQAANGRKNIVTLLTAQRPKPLQEDLQNHLALLDYWRDEAAHSKSVSVTEEKAFTALLLLLRFAQFAEDHWPALTT